MLHAQLDLAEQGYGVLMPLTEHEAFDLVAYRGRKFYRIQVRYRAAVRGRIDVRFRTSWADARGSHNLPLDKRSVDFICVYCPDTRRCYYVNPRMHARGVSLRISKARNNQEKRVLWADDFARVPRPLSSAG